MRASRVLMGFFALIVALGQSVGTATWPAPSDAYAAQDAEQTTPSAAADATTCQVAPRPIEDFAVLVEASPGVAQSWILGIPITTLPPPSGGQPADEATVSAITATVEEEIACINAGDILRLTALWTDQYLRKQFGGVDFADALVMVATPVSIPDVDRSSLVGIEDVRELPDGRVSAVIRTNNGTSVVVFVESLGRYLIDGSYLLERFGTPTP